MTLYQRLRRRFGWDTVEEMHETFPVYEYHIEHTNGEKSSQIANDHHHEDAFLICEDIPYVGYIDIGCGSLTPPWNYGNWKTVGRYDSIQTYSREKIGEDEWVLERDKADGDTEIAEWPDRYKEREK